MSPARTTCLECQTINFECEGRAPCTYCYLNSRDCIFKKHREWSSDEYLKSRAFTGPSYFNYRINAGYISARDAKADVERSRLDPSDTVQGTVSLIDSILLTSTCLSSFPLNEGFKTDPEIGSNFNPDTQLRVGTVLKPKLFIEPFNGSFLKIRSILWNASKRSAFIIGDFYKRLPELSSETHEYSRQWLTGRPPNEVAWICEGFDGDEDPNRFLVTARMSDVKDVHEGLVCRWKYLAILQRGEPNLPSCADWTTVPCVERSLIAEPGLEADKPVASKYEDELISRSKDSRNYFRVTAEQLKYAALEKQQAYTFGDAFCGAGGMSRAAVDAGLQLKWAFDNDSKAIEAYRKNFNKPGLQTYCECDTVFLDRPDLEGELMVDFLHLSPPCPPWSAAQATKGRGPTDEEVKKTLLSTKRILEKVRPRIVTIETVPGLLEFRHAETIGTVVDSFTSLGYSIRWKIINFEDLGLPQFRHRLFLIASRPGEDLPHFPPRTHAERSICQAVGMKPFMSVAEATGNISAGTSDNQHPQRNQGGFPREAWNANSPLRSTILPSTLATIQVAKEGGPFVKLLAYKGFPRIMSFGGIGRQKGDRSETQSRPPWAH